MRLFKIRSLIYICCIEKKLILKFTGKKFNHKNFLYFRALQYSADFEDLLKALNKPSSRVSHGDSCSVLIKILKNNQDILVSHVTWGLYQSMLRVLKNYKLNYSKSPTGKKFKTIFIMN
jgi:hypothetical protein